jgi:predicted RecA/RadA family phage recombinase
MARKHVQPGKVIEVALTATVASGELIKVGELAGVALGSGGNGDSISVAIDEVFNVDKVPTDVIAVGTVVYLDPVNKRVTLATDDGGSPPTDLIRAGVATSAAGNPSATVNVKLNA